MKEKTDIKIVKLNVNDVDQLRDLSVKTFYGSFIHGNTEANMQYYIDHFLNKKRLREELADVHSSFYFALLMEEPVGYLKINNGKAQTELRTENSMEIERIYVDEAYRSMGIGQILFDHALQIARDNRADFLWLGVWEKNQAAVKFYERNGMSQFATHPFQLGDDVQTDIMMKRELL